MIYYDVRVGLTKVGRDATLVKINHGKGVGKILLLISEKAMKRRVILPATRGANTFLF